MAKRQRKVERGNTKWQRLSSVSDASPENRRRGVNRITISVPAHVARFLREDAASRGISLSKTLTEMTHIFRETAAQGDSFRQTKLRLQRRSPKIPTTDLMEALRKSINAEKALTIRTTRHVLLVSNVLIEALQEALDYDPQRHHNRPPPDLRIEDDRYLDELRRLVAELKKLNALLEAHKVAKSKNAARSIGKHFDEFLKNYAGTLGKGAAGLTIACVGALLLRTGVGQPVIDNIWKYWKN